MDKIEQLIHEFKSENTQNLANIDQSKKPNIISALEDFWDDPRVADFLLEVVADGTEYDLARVEALNVFEIKEPTDQADSQKVAGVISGVLMNDKNDLVRRYAAMAATSYMDNDKLFEAIAGIVQNSNEDIDLRYNAFGALERMDNHSRAKSVFEALLRDAEFRQSAEQVLGK